MRPGRTLLVAGLVGGVALVGGSERAGAVRLEPVPEPAILTFPGTKRITYRLRIYGEEREERFILGINPPRFGGEPVPRKGWRPARPGVHEVRAVYPRQRPNVLADSSCQRKLLVPGHETDMRRGKHRLDR